MKDYNNALNVIICRQGTDIKKTCLVQGDFLPAMCKRFPTCAPEVGIEGGGGLSKLLMCLPSHLTLPARE
jgi:hypothetical protein